jgi:hypothetical protein
MSNVTIEEEVLRGTAEAHEGETRVRREGWDLGIEPWSPERERRISMEVVSSGSMIEAIGGFTAIVLSIIALANLVPMYLVPITTLVVGIALLFEGGAVVSRFWSLPSEITVGRWASMELVQGMIGAFLAGVAGVVLGILAMLGFVPLLLTTVSTLVFGSALVLGSGLTARLEHLEHGFEEDPSKRAFYRRRRLASRLVVSAQILLGFGAIVLGILALAGIATLTLTIIALLLVGNSLFVSGTAITNRIMHLLHRC